jgi:hypothetical protein
MAPTPPATLTDFKSKFARDFQYGDGLDKVTDGDINNAMTDARSLFNPSLFSTDDGKLAYLYATAHLLVTNVQAAGGLKAGLPAGLGMQNSPEDIISQRSVGGVSFSSIDPPEFVMKSTLLRQFWSTDYGRRYLMMLEPKLKGAFGVVGGPHEIDTEDGSTPSVPFSEWS